MSFYRAGRTWRPISGRQVYVPAWHQSIASPRRRLALARLSSSSSSGAPPSSRGASTSFYVAISLFAGGAIGFGLSAFSSRSTGSHRPSSGLITGAPISPSDAAAAIASSSSSDPVPFNTSYGSPEDFHAAIAELKNVFKDEKKKKEGEPWVTTEESNLEYHGFSTNSYHPASPPSVVVYPHSTEDVVKIVQISNKYRMPIVPFAGGTSLEGHYSGGGGICVDVGEMDKILAVHEQDMDCVVQPGVGWEDLNRVLEGEKGLKLFFPLDPGPGARIGGMIGTGCSGTNAVRYGTAKAEWILNLTVVLPTGEVIKTRQRARKSSAGFDLTKLFIGAEGTLGIVTEATLRLTPILPTTVAIANFPNVQAATDAVSEVVLSGVPIQCTELCDNVSMRAINLSGTCSKTYPEKDTVFFKFQGGPKAMEEASEMVKDIVRKHGGSGFEFAKTKAEADDLWEGRKEALWSSLALLEGSRAWTTDVCVPLSKLPQLVLETKEDLAKHDLTATTLGHVGDGNFHAIILFRDEDELKKVHDAVHRMIERALRLEGTCTGEHGVGLGKKEYLIAELGPGTVKVMREIKKLLDPLNLLNPGKLYPDLSQTQSQAHHGDH